MKTVHQTDCAIFLPENIEWPVPTGTNLEGRAIFLWALYKPHPTAPEENTRRKAITKLIEAVAEQQEALARILEAEHKKSRR